MSVCSSKILLWCLFSVVLTIFILLILFILYVIHLRDEFIHDINEHLEQLCNNTPPLQYMQAPSIPVLNGSYERALALELLTIAVNTSGANCFNNGNIANPLGFDNQLRINGIEPVSGSEVMFAYIYWNNTSQAAVIAFSATELVSEWESDFQIGQVVPYGINGIKDGTLMHKGFYNIYFGIRQQLWDWWNQNMTYINTLYITGHSLGGALSTICAFDFATVFLDRECNLVPANSQTCLASTGTTGICMCDEFDPCIVQKLPIHYSFASPRVGNVIFAQTFLERLPTSIRVNNTEDVIPQLPLAQQGSSTYEQTFGSVPFTQSLGSLGANHSIAYYDHLPDCPQVAGCTIINPSMR